MYRKIIHCFVPILIEVVELHDVSLFKLELLIVLVESKLIDRVLLEFELELCDPILSHFSLDVLALLLTLESMLVKDFNEFLYVGVLREMTFGKISVLALIHNKF